MKNEKLAHKTHIKTTIDKLNDKNSLFKIIMYTVNIILVALLLISIGGLIILNKRKQEIVGDEKDMEA